MLGKTQGRSPGKFYRNGITLPQLAEMFPDENIATKWFEAMFWPDGPVCPRCKGKDVCSATHKTMPYRCRTCKRFFSVKAGTVLAGSKVSLLKWVWAIYLELTALKGVSSMKLHRDLSARG